MNTCEVRWMNCFIAGFMLFGAVVVAAAILA